MRYCDVCGKPMTEGFVIGEELEYYCSHTCMSKVLTDEEYHALYSRGEAYWTEWEEEEEVEVNG